MTDLPETEYDATHTTEGSNHRIDVTAKRPNPGGNPQERKWTGEGYSVSGAVKDVFKKAFEDGASAEFISPKKK